MIHIEQITQGYWASEEPKNRLLSLLMLARELRADRAVSLDRTGNISYCVEDIRYVSMLKELAVLISRIPTECTPRVHTLAVKYLQSLYNSTDILIITK